MSVTYSGHFFTANYTITPAVITATDKTSAYAVSVVKAKTPVRTGRLQQGWTGTTEVNGFRIANPVSYTPYVEDGTRFMVGRHMLLSSTVAISQHYRDTIKAEIAKHLGASNG